MTIMKKYVLIVAAALGLMLGLIAAPTHAQVNSGNLSAILLPSAARTATSVVSADITNTQWRGGHFIVNVSAYASGTYTPTIQGKDPASGTYYTILEGNAISATGTTVLKVYPGATPIAGGVASDIIPKTFRVSMAASSTATVTYSVGASLSQ